MGEVMTVKILKDCLTNYNSSCKIYISYGEGNKSLSQYQLTRSTGKQVMVLEL